ncbi:transposase [Arthrobacter sp. B1805]|uniref:IS110 family transposase n=1 Tax=Arthrobacter sp. B1805 TaxID=2058892 RepID=UPI000CE513B1|nr:transposase [Arthrobacter sp. B1805]
MPAFWVGIDSGKRAHHCVVIDQIGTVLLSKRVENDETALLELIATVAEIAEGREVSWATDLNAGGAALLIELLAAHAQQLLYIPGRIVHHAAATYRGDGKTDAKDARIIADQARMRTDLQPVRGADQISVDLRLLTARRTDLICDRVRSINRLRATLLEYFPALERAFDYSKKAPLLLLGGYQTMGSKNSDLPQHGTRVAVSPTVSCAVCDFCRIGRDNSCRNKKILGVHRWGGYAEYAAVPTRNLINIPDDVSFEAAACAATSYAIAWHLVVTRGRVATTDTVLVVGAAGAVGIAAAQIAALHGARVILSGRSASRLKPVADHVGAYGVAISNTSDYETQISVLAPDGIDMVVETVGSATWDSSLSFMRSEGRIVCCGASSGHDVKMSLRDLYRKNLAILTASSGTFNDLRQVLSLFDHGRLTPIIAQTYPLSMARQAHDDLALQKHVGKLVLFP